MNTDMTALLDADASSTESTDVTAVSSSCLPEEERLALIRIEGGLILVNSSEIEYLPQGLVSNLCSVRGKNNKTFYRLTTEDQLKQLYPDLGKEIRECLEQSRDGHFMLGSAFDLEYGTITPVRNIDRVLGDRPMSYPGMLFTGSAKKFLPANQVETGQHMMVVSLLISLMRLLQQGAYAFFFHTPIGWVTHRLHEPNNWLEAESRSKFNI